MRPPVVQPATAPQDTDQAACAAEALAPGRDPWAWRFALAWCLPVSVAAAATASPWRALLVVVISQLVLAALEWVPALRRSPAARPASPWHRWCLRVHLVWQAALLGVGVGVAAVMPLDADAVLSAIALGVAVGWVTGAQGITYAHELGHRRSVFDRAIAWVLMTSVLYPHFMVEHYRGHHRLAATRDDPASARAGESLWQFLPRTLAGSWRSAWALEHARLLQRQWGWWRSPLAWALMVQGSAMGALALAGGPLVLLFWLVQAAMAVLLLETVNYIEHYGLERAEVGDRREPFGVQHAWNADAVLSNCVLANLQRHSDHHLNAWKPYENLQALAGPQLPTGYAGCVMLAMIPPLWFGVMDRRLPAPRPAVVSSPAAGARP